jgi:acid phosphatase (class A)
VRPGIFGKSGRVTMFLGKSAALRVMVLAAVSAAGCATVEVVVAPTDLKEERPGYIAGYVKPSELPDSVALLPPPPAAGSAAAAHDVEVHKATRKLRDTPRWGLAIRDAETGFPKAAETFSCALAMPVSAESTPHLNMLLRRVRADSSRINDRAKQRYQRERPYKVLGDSNCTPGDARLKDDSYPSGHAAIGWAWALVLTEVAPDRADAILARGLEFGQSRVVCGVHWKSDVEAGRLLGTAAVSRLHADPVFRAQVAGARREVEAARAAGLRSPLDCESEAKALAAGR